VRKDVLPGEVFEVEEVGLVLAMELELLQVPEHLVKTGVADAVRREDITRRVGTGLLDVVVLEVDKLLILDGPLGRLTVEEGSERPWSVQFLAVLRGKGHTSFNFSPMRRARLKFPTVATASIFF
jgi:hypothetical protein